jgi:copper type II ascorbate-dependent monooxygenase-like protein
MRRIWAATLACLVLGGAVDAKRLHLRKPRHGFQMRMTPFVIPPNTDREGCEYRTTPNRKAMDVQAFELRATPGTHHFVVWDYLGRDRNPTDFWTGIRYSPGCVGLGPQDSFATTANLFGMQTARARVEFPPGIAVRLDPHAIVYPNLHFHNYTDKPVLGQAVFNFVAARDGTVLHHAQALTVGTFQINIPPLSTAALTGEWRTPNVLNIVQLSTHQHHRGTLMSIHHIDAAGNDMGELVVSDNWEHPNVQWYPQTLRLAAGEGLRFTCEWNNPDDHAVHFGPTTEDEMCFVTGYFYPDDESVPATGPGCIPQGSGLECFVRKLS